MTELSDYKRLVEAPAIRSYEATITSLRAEVSQLQQDNERLTEERDEALQKLALYDLNAESQRLNLE